jgi:nicotinamidase/pyrazinamidase
LIVRTKDWHPLNHKSFASNHPHKKIYDVIQLGEVQQTLWPNHCVQNTSGAEFAKDLTNTIYVVVLKGMNPEIDSYSGFRDNSTKNITKLESILRDANIDKVFVVGLATDYCVKFTVLDALRLGFKTTVMLNGCRGVNINQDDSDKAIQEMQNAGAVILPTPIVTTPHQS